MGARFRHLFARLERYSEHPAYIPFIGVLAALDFVVAVVPTDALLISTAAIKPKRWIYIAFLVALGSTAGATAFAWAIDHWGSDWIHQTFPKFFEGKNWKLASDTIQKHGIWGIFFFALGPIPLQPAIIACGLSHTSPIEIMIATFAGRIPKYLLFSWGASHGSKWLRFIGGDKNKIQPE